MILTCPEEAYRYVGAAILDALSEHAPGARPARYPTGLTVGLVDPDCVLFIDASRHELRFGGVEDRSPALIAMKGDAAVSYCQGRLDLDSAVASGDVAIHGDGRELLEALSAGARVIHSFEAIVRREGRVDLLAEPIAC